MAKKVGNSDVAVKNGKRHTVKKVTSIGKSKFSKYKKKRHKMSGKKAYRGQGK